MESMDNNKKALLYNIVWDTDGKKIAGLPDNVEVAVASDTDLEYEGADILSDKYGWCVESYSFRDLD